MHGVLYTAGISRNKFVRALLEGKVGAEELGGIV